MRVGPKSFVFVVLVLTAFLVGGMSGQTTTSGALAGVVVDQTGAVVPGAVVEIADVAKGTTESSKTDSAGIYQFSFLRPGRYTLKATHPGFQEERRSVSVQVGPSVTVNITL